MVIGLAGQIASGKSVVAAEWQKLGAQIVSGDQLGREVVDQNASVRRRLARVFGSQILTPGGRLRRQKLGELVFADPAKTEALNQIVHPPLLSRLRKQITAYRRKPTAPLLVIDAALIFGWQLQEELDIVIVVESRIVDQVRRLKRLGLSEVAARDRIRRQLSKSRQRALADFVILNHGSIVALRKQARQLLKKLLNSVDKR